MWKPEALSTASRKDEKGVGEALGHELENGPPDVELLEKLVPEGGEKGREVLARAKERLKAVVEDYPEVTKYRQELERLERVK